jgi:hypothetical protein
MKIPLQTAKARLRQFRLLLPALVLVKSNEKINFKNPGLRVARAVGCNQIEW